MNKIIGLLSMVLISLSTNAQTNLDSILSNPDRSSKHTFYTVIFDENNRKTSLPTVVLKGKNEGPVFTILAGVHGYEYPPIIASQELIQEINPKELTGTLIIIPMANPTAFYSRTPFLNPHDHLNLNRIFPGSETGSITERIAHHLTHNVMSQSDIVLDIHGGDANEDLLPFVCYYNNEKKPVQTQRAKELSEASGFGHVVSYGYTLGDDEPAKYAFKQAVQDGKVGLSIECGKLGSVQLDAVKKIKKGVYRMLNQLNMLTYDEVDELSFQSMNSQSYIRSEDKGILFSQHVAGDSVKEGEIVGILRNEFGEKIKEIKATVSGTILYKIGTPPVNVGETIMCIGYKK